MIRPISSVLLLFAGALLFQAGCSTSESDGRKYHTNASPIQGKMGVHYKRVRADTQTAASTAPTPAPTVESDGLLGSILPTNDEPAGLMDRNEKPDEPGAKYWMHGQQSANPVMGKMGVRVQRKKKE